MDNYRTRELENGTYDTGKQQNQRTREPEHENDEVDQYQNWDTYPSPKINQPHNWDVYNPQPQKLEHL